MTPLNTNDNNLAAESTGHGPAPLVELFDPPMCCSTGLCGPTLDQELLNVNEMVLRLQEGGVPVARYQMTSHPQKFLGHPDVMQLVQTQQMAALPIIVVDGQIIKSGAYPSETEIRNALTGVVTN